MLRRLLNIFCIFRAICEYYAGKSLPHLLRAIFSRLRTNRSAARQVRDPSGVQLSRLFIRTQLSSRFLYSSSNFNLIMNKNNQH